MNKEFVTYEQALALKELGFDEPCFFAFDNCSTPMRCSDLRTNEQKFNGVNYNSSSYTSQPTYSQVFRWFREKYNLKAYIIPIEYLDGTQETYQWNIFNKCHSGVDHLTYEEAEQACLDKLIEITNEEIKNR